MIDARVLSGPTTGTQLHVVELIGAVARTGHVRVTAILPEAPSEHALSALRSFDGVTLATRADAERLDRADVVHRPYQVNNDDDLALLARLADRVIITNQDLIGYHNPTYFRDFQAWSGYRRITRAALAVADHVVFFSEHARRQALTEDLVDPSRTSVVHIGVDHAVSGPAPAPVPPPGHAGLAPGTPAILCIGTDFHHKNRLFALRVLDALRTRHAWSGVLLLVGPRVAGGSSSAEEAELLASSPGLENAVRAFPAVSEGEKAWLYERSSVALYPTVARRLRAGSV